MSAGRRRQTLSWDVVICARSPTCVFLYRLPRFTAASCHRPLQVLKGGRGDTIFFLDHKLLRNRDPIIFMSPGPIPSICKSLN